MINVFLDGPIRKSVLTSVIGFGLLGCASLQKPKVEDAPERYGSRLRCNNRYAFLPRIGLYGPDDAGSRG